MHRIFGRAKPTEPVAPAAPPPSLDGHVTKLNTRTSELDTKIAQADQELLQIKGQLAKTRLPAQQASLKQKALQILKRKQMYTSQRDQMMSRAFNLEQTQFAIDSMKEAKDTIDVMRSAAAMTKEMTSGFDIGSVEDLHDDMFESMADVAEINEVLSRPLDAYNDVNEADLDAALAGLDDELLAAGAPAEGVAAGGSASAAPAFDDLLSMPSGPSAVAAGGAGGGAASYAMPSVPSSAAPAARAPAASAASAARF